MRTSVESGPMSSSMRRYAEEDERSLRQTGQSSRRSTLRSTGRSPSPTPCSAMRSPSPKQSMEVRVSNQGCQFSELSLISDFFRRKATGIKLIKFGQNRDKSSRVSTDRHDSGKGFAILSLNTVA